LVLRGVEQNEIKRAIAAVGKHFKHDFVVYHHHAFGGDNLQNLN